MTPRERILAALRWEEPDRVPLTVYDWMLPRGAVERGLREQGVGLIVRLPAHRVEHREVQIVSREYRENGRSLIRRTIRTPVGEVWQTLEPDASYGTSNWIREHFLKGPEDYRPLGFYFKDMVFSDNGQAVKEAQRRLGGDGLVMVRIAKSPLQEMLYQLMGMERFSVDYSERRDAFDSLHDAMMARHRELCALAARCPADVLQLGDNIHSAVVGRDRFRRYLAPDYARLSGLLSGTGKLLAVHMDGTLRSLREEIAAAEFDVVEAMTPPPMGDFSVREARASWPGKALWVNFPGCLLIAPPETVADHTRSLLAEAGSSKGFAIGVTEDAPVEALERALGVIAGVLLEAGTRR